MKKIFRVIGYDDENKAMMPDARSKSPEKGPKEAMPLKTPFGELVYMRNGSNKDFVSKQRLTNTEPKDEVLDENLLDVKNLLKNSSSSQAANGK